MIVTRPSVVSTTEPTGICSPSSSFTNRFVPGLLILTVPRFGTALTVLPASGGGNCGCEVWVTGAGRAGNEVVCTRGATGGAAPRTTITRLAPPNVENR